MDKQARSCLVGLLEIDNAIDRAEGDVAKIMEDQTISRINFELNELEQLRSSLRDELLSARVKINSLANTLSALEERKSKAKKLSETLEDSRSIEASKKEYAAINEEIDDVETEELELLERTSSFEKKLLEVETSIQEKSSKVNELKEIQLKKLQESKSNLDSLLSKRKEYLGNSPPDIRALIEYYLSLRDKGVKPAAGFIVHGICTACHLSVPFDIVAQTKKEDDSIISCEECGCILLGVE